MVQHRQPALQGVLRWTRVLDLSGAPAAGGADPIGAITTHLGRGDEVTVRFGDRRPLDLDGRIPFLLAEALQAGVNITIEGAAIGSWWHAIHDILYPPALPGRVPRSRRRHLAVVRP